MAEIYEYAPQLDALRFRAVARREKQARKNATIARKLRQQFKSGSNRFSHVGRVPNLCLGVFGRKTHALERGPPPDPAGQRREGEPHPRE